MERQGKKKEEKCTHEYRIKGWPKVSKLKTGKLTQTDRDIEEKHRKPEALKKP